MSQRPITDIQDQFRMAQQNHNLLNPGSNTENYAVYSALVTQSGSQIPEAIVLNNSFKNKPAWDREGVGNYTLTLMNSFPENRIAIIPGSMQAGTGSRVITWEWLNKNSIRIRTTADGAYSDSILVDTFIEIRVYLV